MIEKDTAKVMKFGDKPRRKDDQEYQFWSSRNDVEGYNSLYMYQIIENSWQLNVTTINNKKHARS